MLLLIIRNILRHDQSFTYEIIISYSSYTQIVIDTGISFQVNINDLFDIPNTLRSKEIIL